MQLPPLRLGVVYGTGGVGATHPPAKRPREPQGGSSCDDHNSECDRPQHLKRNTMSSPLLFRLLRQSKQDQTVEEGDQLGAAASLISA
jgi:hypothetical protein